MLNLRIIQSLFFAVALFLGQQGGAMHALRHALDDQAQQQNKQAPASHDCEQCISYAQLGSALNIDCLTFDLGKNLIQANTQHRFFFLSPHSLPAVARGPPSLQSTV